MEIRCSQAQVALAEKWHRLFDEGKDAEAEAIREQLTRELGEEGCTALLDYVEERQENAATMPKPKPKPAPKIFKRARRVSKSAESWRCLSDYPAYEISSHGRVRAIDRARPADWLKPRRRWFRGMCVDYVVITDRDGRRCERMVGKLLIAAGFLPRPAWMRN